MAEIMEVFEDFGNNSKKLMKNKKFWILAGGTAAVALLAGYLKNKDSDSGAVTGYDAIGYAGYPTVGGASSSENVFTSDETIGYLDSILGETTTEYDGVMSEMQSNIDSLTDRLISSEEKSSSYQKELERQNAISQMRANSELYNVLSKPEDAATRELLHAENLAIAEKFGWEFDASTGNYYEGNSVVYTTAKQQAGYNTAYGGKTAAKAETAIVNNKTYTEERTTAATKGYDPDVDYSLAIQNAKKAGASESTIKALETARQAKIDDKYGGVEPNMTGKNYTFSSTQK